MTMAGLPRPQCSHLVLFGAVVQHPDSHFAHIRRGKLFDAHRIEGRAEPRLRVQPQIRPGLPLFTFRHFHHPGISFPGQGAAIRSSLDFSAVKWYHAHMHGELSEWFKEPVLKTGDGATHREFESHTLRQKEMTIFRGRLSFLLFSSLFSLRFSLFSNKLSFPDKSEERIDKRKCIPLRGG